MSQVDRTMGLVGNVAMKAPCRVATTAAITLSGLQTIDGIALAAGDRVLVKNQASSIANGIYEADTGDWNRTDDANGALDMVFGTMVKVNAGTVGQGFYYQSTDADITIGTSAIVWSAASTIFAVVSAFMQGMLDDPDAATARTTLGLGTADAVTFASVNAGSLTASGSVAGASLAASALTTGRVVYTTTAGALAATSDYTADVANARMNLGLAQIGTGSATYFRLINSSLAASDANAAITQDASGNTRVNASTGAILSFSINDTFKGAFSAAGNFIVGTSSDPGNHRIARSVAADAGNAIGDFANLAGPTAAATFYSVSGTGANAANAAAKFNQDNTTSRSINAAGSINASGADYADYETKAVGCGNFKKGDIVGFDINGLLTDKWSQVVSGFGVKSTLPSMVGGDAWGAVLGDPPAEPELTVLQYTGPLKPDPVDIPKDATEQEAAALLEQRQAKLDDYRTQWQAYKAAVRALEEKYSADVSQWERSRAAFVTEHEKLRVKVDRIAKAGKVPCNVYGATPGHYIVAQEGPNDTIIGASVQKPDEIQRDNRVGRVRAVMPDGRAMIEVIACP